MVTQTRRRTRGSRRRIFGESGLDAILPYLLLAPTVLLVLAVLVYPLIEGVRTSTGFYRFGAPLRDVGLDNYVQALHDPAFLGSVVTTLEFVVAAVVLETALGLALALLCAREVRFIRAIRGSLILPMIVTPVVVGIIFRLIYASDVGLVATLARSVGLAPPEILGQPNAAFAGLVFLDVWEWTPLMFLILLAGIQSLPVEPFEAAKVDGAGAWRTFVDHTLPMLRPTILVAVTLRSIDALTTFDQVYVLTRGGPGNRDPAHLDLRLPDVLPVPAVRLRRGAAHHGGARRHRGGGVGRRAHAEAAMRRAPAGAGSATSSSSLRRRRVRRRPAAVDGLDVAEVEPRDHPGRHPHPALVHLRQLRQPVQRPRIRLLPDELHRRDRGERRDRPALRDARGLRGRPVPALAGDGALRRARACW